MLDTRFSESDPLRTSAVAWTCGGTTSLAGFGEIGSGGFSYADWLLVCVGDACDLEKRKWPSPRRPWPCCGSGRRNGLSDRTKKLTKEDMRCTAELLDKRSPIQGP